MCILTNTCVFLVSTFYPQAAAPFFSRNFSNSTNNVQPRLTKLFIKALTDKHLSLGSYYGAIAGLGELGTEVILPCVCVCVCWPRVARYRGDFAMCLC